MENRFYLDGKCILSIDWDVFSSDEDHTNLYELFIDPIATKVYEKYYEKQLIHQTFEKVFQEEDIVFQAYCDIKPLLVEYKESSGDYDDYIENLMREQLKLYKYENFNELREKMILALNSGTADFLCNGSSMIEHIWRECGTDKKRRGINPGD